MIRHHIHIPVPHADRKCAELSKTFSGMMTVFCIVFKVWFVIPAFGFLLTLTGPYKNLGGKIGYEI